MQTVAWFQDQRRNDRPGAASPLVVVWVAVALCVLVPTVIVVSLPRPSVATWDGSLWVTTVSGLTYAWIIALGQRRLSQLTFTLFTYLFLGLAPMVQQRAGSDPTTTPGLEHRLDYTTYGIVVAGFVCFMMGSFISRRLAVRDGTKVVTPDRRELDVSLARTLILSALGVTSGLYYITTVGLGPLFSSRDSLSRTTTAIWSDTNSALIKAISSMTLLVAFVAHIRIRRRRHSPDAYHSLVFCAVTVTLFIVVNPITSPRYVFGTVALAVTAAVGLYATANRFRVVAASAVVVMVYLFPLLSAFRRGSDGARIPFSAIDTLKSGDFDSFAQISNTVRYVLVNGLTNGHQALGVVLFWVPRSVWPSKPTDTGILLAASRGYGFTNLSAPLWSELYINGGWILLIVGMTALGFLSGKADLAIERRLTTGGTIGILGCILPFYQIILLRGSLLQAMSTLAVIVMSATFILYRRRSLLDRAMNLERGLPSSMVILHNAPTAELQT